MIVKFSLLSLKMKNAHKYNLWINSFKKLVRTNYFNVKTKVLLRSTCKAADFSSSKKSEHDPGIKILLRIYFKTLFSGLGNNLRHMANRKKRNEFLIRSSFCKQKNIGIARTYSITESKFPSNNHYSKRNGKKYDQNWINFI